jgi:xylose dehydrogenase (NAD/NADP)
MTVSFGLLSTAAINRKLLAGARRSELVDVVAVASRDPDRAEAFAREHGIARAHGSYEALLGDPDVECVYVSVPNALHHVWTLRALRAGKHVLCEKPYSRRPDEVEEAFAVAEREGRLLSEAFMYRYNPQIETLAALVRDGAVGKLRIICAAFSHPCDRPGDVRLDAELDGGSLMDVGCYCVSAARLLAGEPVGAAAHQVIGETGVDVRFTGSLEFGGGALAHFDCGFGVPDRSMLEVVGTEGAIAVSDPWHCLAPGLELRPRGGEPRQVPVARENSYRLELEHLARRVRGEPASLLGRDDALGQARTIAALYAAAAAGAPIAA